MTKFLLLAFISCLLQVFTSAVPSGRIVGGTYATDGQFPHQISLRIRDSHTCGGSIISKNFVLTAAHCVEASNNPRDYTIRAGSNNRFTGGVIVQPVEIRIHENYGDFLNDVALIRLESPLIFSDHIKAIPIATAEVPNGKEIIISGWGRVKTGGDLPTNLLWNTLESISRSRCAEWIGMDSDTLICLAHTWDNGACNGDSGGPAMYNGQLVGVAGFVVGGCGSSYPDGYAKVSYHVEWIKKHSDL